MFLTFFTLAAFILPWVYGSSKHDIDPPANPQNKIETFQFTRPLSWSNQDFNLMKEDNKTKVMSIETKMKEKHLEWRFALHLTLLPSQEHLDVKINGRVIHCGIKQTYKIMKGDTDVYQFMADPRGPLVDRWYIKKNGGLAHSYTWMRQFQGLAGVVKSDDDRKVAYLRALTWGSEDYSAFEHSTIPGSVKYEIKTNGDVPLEILVALYTSAVVRMDECQAW